MAITTVDGMIAALPGQMLQFLKIAPAMQTVGQWYSPWLLAGIPGPGTAPSSGVGGNTVSSSTDGGMVFTNPASGLSYLYRLGYNSSVLGMLHLYDRLWHNSGLSATLTTGQTVNSVALPSRCPVVSDPTGETFDTNGAFVEAWMQVYGTAMGAGTLASTITYTDEAGNTGATGTQQGWISAAAIGRTFPYSLAAGDRGVRSIQTYTCTATNTSGVFGLVLRRRLATAAVSVNATGVTLDFGQTGMPAIPDSAHLELIYVPTVTTAPTLLGDVAVIQG